MEPELEVQQVLPAPTPEPQPEPTPEFVDPDDKALAEAKALATSQEEPVEPGANAAPEPQPAPVTPAAPAAAAAEGEPEPVPEPQPAGTKSPMIPKQRLDQALAERDENLRAATYWKGVADARAQAQPGAPVPVTQQPQEQPKTFEQQLVDIHSEEIALAEKYEAGEITLVEMKRAEQGLRDREQTVREAAFSERVKSELPSPQPLPGGDMRLEELTADLEKQHPYLNLIAETDAAGNPTGLTADQVERYWGFMTNEAVAKLASEGHDLRGKSLSSQDKLMLRATIAEISDAYGPVWTGRKLAEPAAAPAPKPATPPAKVPQPQQQPLSRTATDRLNALTKRQDMPVDVNALSGAGNDKGEPTEEELLAMSEEQILALPEATRRSLLGPI